MVDDVTNALQRITQRVNNPNAVSGTASGIPSVQTNQSATPVRSLTSGSSTDYRLRIKPLDMTIMQSAALLGPLALTNGVLFPYQPTVNVSHQVEYPSMQMTHSNQDYFYYARTNNVTVSINAKFTVQNQAEGRYALAVLHFFRTVTKMRFGQDDPYAGLPPTICTLSGYGNYNFNEVRCIVKGHNFTFDERIDMVTVYTDSSGVASSATSLSTQSSSNSGTSNSYGGGSAVRLPALFNLTADLIVQQTGQYMRKQFSLDSYKSGALLDKGGYI